MLKAKVLKLEKRLSDKAHWSGVAFVNEQLDTMEIPTLGFKGTVEEGYRKLDSMEGDTVVFTGEDGLVD